MSSYRGTGIQLYLITKVEAILCPYAISRKYDLISIWSFNQ